MQPTVNHVRLRPLTSIRPNLLSPTPQPAQGGADAGRMSAARAFFALASGQGQPTAAAVQAPAQDLTAPAQVVRAATPADPQKIARPGSLFDIRV